MAAPGPSSPPAAYRRIRRAVRSGVVLCVLLATAGALAHPFHGSYAELEWSAEGTLDVALQVIPEDLERALTALAGEKTVLRDTPVVRELLARYLDEHFRLSNAAPDRGPRIVGMELDYRETWIYFSLDADRGASAVLRNTLLMDLERTQTNRVKRLWQPGAPVLVFSAAEPERAL